jgi:hypothetical protein
MCEDLGSATGAGMALGKTKIPSKWNYQINRNHSFKVRICCRVVRKSTSLLCNIISVWGKIGIRICAYSYVERYTIKCKLWFSLNVSERTVSWVMVFPLYNSLVPSLLKELATNIIYCHPSPHHQLSSVKNVLLLLVDTFLKLMSA